jgi:hypothetical protein
VPLCHVPVPSQIWGVWPLHRLVVGVHDPEQAPPLHTLAHGVPSTQLPFASHVSGVRLAHCLVVGVHEPVHAPFTQA